MAEARRNAVKTNPHPLRWLNHTLPEPAANLQFDEDLLAAAEPVLRVWETPEECVVLGRGGRPEREVRLEACVTAGVPVLRRCSGGGAVVLARGCLNYALVLPLHWNPQWRDVARSVRWVMERMRDALAVPGLAVEGAGDLAINGKKVSGSAQRRSRHAFLHHGTLLYDFNPALAERLLHIPSRQPAYRAARGHAEFLANLPLPAPELRARLAAAWCGPGF